MTRVKRKRLIVISLGLVLLGWMISDWASRTSVQAKKAAQQQDLSQMRAAIRQYTKDKNESPQSLDDLVTAGYLRAIPKDPFTGSASTWQTDQSDLTSPITENSGITTVESGSTQVSSDGTAYSTW